MKHKTFLLALFLVLHIGVANSQCNCTENFEFVYSKLKANYAGWLDKTTPDPQGFAMFTEQQRTKASSEKNPNYCYKIIHDWLAYFRDRHTSIYSKGSELNFDSKRNEEIRAHFATTENVTLTEQQVKDKIDTSNNMEGIWQNEAYTIAIVKSKNTNRDYIGVILKADSVYWMPGQVKIELEEKTTGEYEALFYMRDHSVQITNATLDGNELQFGNLSSFTKVYPQVETIKQVERLENISTKVELRKINANTFYLRLPTFDHVIKSALDSILLAHHETLIETPNLIIDVRNNGGGDDVTYSTIIPYLFTNKIKLINNSILSSPDNIAKFEAILNNPAYPESNKSYIRKLVKDLKANPNAFYKKEDFAMNLRKIFPYPKRVVILINKNCGSSCEEFLLTAQQSKKVTLMGEHTMGVLDYANVHTLDLPYREWGLQYATSRSNRLPDYPIDNIGIEPSIKIPNDVDWIAFAMQYIKGN